MKINCLPLFFVLLTAICLPEMVAAEKLVIIGTNDTHSQIDPDDEDGLGGVLRRKVLVDSIRNATTMSCLSIWATPCKVPCILTSTVVKWRTW